MVGKLDKEKKETKFTKVNKVPQRLTLPQSPRRALQIAWVIPQSCPDQAWGHWGIYTLYHPAWIESRLQGISPHVLLLSWCGCVTVVLFPQPEGYLLIERHMCWLLGVSILGLGVQESLHTSSVAHGLAAPAKAPPRSVFKMQSWSPTLDIWNYRIQYNKVPQAVCKSPIKCEKGCDKGVWDTGCSADVVCYRARQQVSKFWETPYHFFPKGRKCAQHVGPSRGTSCRKGVEDLKTDK